MIYIHSYKEIVSEISDNIFNQYIFVLFLLKIHWCICCGAKSRFKKNIYYKYRSVEGVSMQHEYNFESCCVVRNVIQPMCNFNFNGSNFERAHKHTYTNIDPKMSVLLRCKMVGATVSLPYHKCKQTCRMQCRQNFFFFEWSLRNKSHFLCISCTSFAHKKLENEINCVKKKGDDDNVSVCICLLLVCHIGIKLCQNRNYIRKIHCTICVLDLHTHTQIFKWHNEHALFLCDAWQTIISALAVW